ncbi:MULTISPECIES: hypothetical protein [unclassified Mesorhizobium]|uniref:hypothetical protein n=1 Tax=unclassified Mesorhizobium TaxID=325217 RepID=UPI001FE08701|nr:MULTISPECIES: hypothetical protein [unclassified Mesorhizobium]
MVADVQPALIVRNDVDDVGLRWLGRRRLNARKSGKYPRKADGCGKSRNGSRRAGHQCVAPRDFVAGFSREVTIVAHVVPLLC